jgi:hypothetical protein
VDRERIGFVTCAAAILFWQLIVPPVVGLANNGDFSKTYGIFNLTEPPGDEVRFADTRFVFDPQAHYSSRFYSSEQLLLLPALVLNGVFSKDGSFDLRFIGIIHAALFLYAAWLFPTLLSDAPRPMRLIAYVLVLLIFGDVMYTAYLNSFYMDVPAYLFVLLGTVLFLRAARWRRTSDTILLWICCVMMTTSKAQHAALGLWAALLIGLSDGKRGARAAIFAGCLATLAVLWLAKSTPTEYSLRGCFTMAFYQVLPHAKNVDRTITDLGLNDSYRQYIGMHSFSDGSPMDDARFVADFHWRISYASLAWFFLTHPRDAYTALRHSLDAAGRQRPVLGNFDITAGMPPLAESRSFALWSNLKRRLFEHRGPRFFFCFLGLSAAVAVLLFLQRRRLERGEFLGGYILIGMTATELAISSLADAVEIPRHHLLFYAQFDLLVIAAACLAMRCLVDHSSGR